MRGWGVAVAGVLVAASPAAAWEYLERPDQASGTPVQFAFAQSDNEIAAEGAVPQRATLSLRVHPEYGRTALVTLADGFFVCPAKPCAVGVQLDEAKPQQVAAVLPGGARSAVILVRDPDRFFKDVGGASRPRMSTRLDDGSEATFDFDVAGLAWPPSPPTLKIDQILGSLEEVLPPDATERNSRVPSPPVRKPSR